MKSNKFSELKNKATVIVLFIIAFYWIFLVFSEARWKTGDTIVSDTKSYYTYLPAAFIQNDLSLRSLDQLSEEEGAYVWYLTNDDDRFLRLTMGVAICNAPLFLVAHTIALNSDEWRASGYSTPYFLAIHLTALIFGLWGLLLIRRLCKRFLDDLPVAIVLIILAFGTNLTFYTTYYPGYSHVFSFWAVAMFVWLTLKWYDDGNSPRRLIGIGVALGLVSGIIALIRPMNAIIALFFLFWGISNWGGFKARIRLLWDRRLALSFLLIVALLLVSLQFVYWKIALGVWFFDSYEEQGFHFSNPRFLDVLFSFRKGWLLYTPIASLAIIGFVWLRKTIKEAFVPVLMVFLLHLYLISSWFSWWYGDGYSQRAMVDFYPILALPMGALLMQIINKKKLLIGGVTIAATLFLLLLNTVQMEQYKNGIIHYDGMTKEAYLTTWMKSNFPRNYSQFIIQPDLRRLDAGENEYISSTADFDSIASYQLNYTESNLVSNGSPEGVRLDSMNFFTPVFSIPLGGITNPEKRLRAICTVNLFCEKITSQEQFRFYVSTLAKEGGNLKVMDSWPGTLDEGKSSFLLQAVDLWGPYQSIDSLKLSVEYKSGAPVYVESINVQLLECAYPD